MAPSAATGLVVLSNMSSTDFCSSTNMLKQSAELSGAVHCRETMSPQK